VHFDNTSLARPGDFVEVEITDASAHYLIGQELSHMKTRGGDAHARRTEDSAPTPGVMLGIPSFTRAKV
jgi:tRNA-2-methylthio-N6-dimethylallyladenosine synthase